MANKRATMKQIAKLAGTSIGTVDRALSNRPGINPQTKERVLQVAADLGYTRNTMASALSRRKRIRIGVISAENPVGFYSYIDRGVDRAAQDYGDYGVEVERIYTPYHTPDSQKELLESLDISQFDALAINVGGRETAPFIDRFIQNGIPVITFNSDSPESRRLFFIGNDARQSGRLAGELIGKLLEGKGQVAVVGNFINTNTFIDRYGGFCEVLQSDYPGVTIYPCAECFSEPERAYHVVSNILKQEPNLAGFFATGYSATVGMVQALKDANRKDVKIIGYDLCPQIMDALAGGWCTATLYQEPVMQGYQAVRLLVRYLVEGWRPVSQRLFVETKVIFKQNMSSYTQNQIQQDPFQ